MSQQQCFSQQQTAAPDSQLSSSASNTVQSQSQAIQQNTSVDNQQPQPSIHTQELNVVQVQRPSIPANVQAPLPLPQPNQPSNPQQLQEPNVGIPPPSQRSANQLNVTIQPQQNLPSRTQNSNSAQLNQTSLQPQQPIQNLPSVNRNLNQFSQSQSQQSQTNQPSLSQNVNVNQASQISSQHQQLYPPSIQAFNALNQPFTPLNSTPMPSQQTFSFNDPTFLANQLQILQQPNVQYLLTYINALQQQMNVMQ